MQNLSLHISPGDRAGLIGNNGTGKSTLMKIIAGIIKSDKGDIIPAPHIEIAYLPQERQCNTDKTLYDEMLSLFSEVFEIEQFMRELEMKMQTEENIEEILRKYSEAQSKLDTLEVSTIEAKIGKVLYGLGFKYEDTKKITSHFSGGWQARIELAKILLKNPDLLLLDEPTNHLDLEAIEWLEEFLLNYNGSYLIVSHDRYLLDRLTERTLEIEKGKIYDYPGNYSYYIMEKEHRQELAEIKYENQQKYLEKSQRFIDRFRYKATKARQVKSREKKLEKIEKIIPYERNEKKIKFTFLFETQSGREVIKIKNLSKSYDDKCVIKKAEFLVKRGDKIALTGKNGSGKSTLIKILAGLLPFDKGKVDFGYNVSPAYFSQHQGESLNGQNSVLQELREIAPLSITDQALRTILGCFLFTGEDVFKEIKDLSGGEKSRVALAKIIVKPSNLLLMDEPTNHLDISSLEVLEEALLEYAGTILFISHDRYFIDRLADMVFEIEDGELNIYEGDYSYYIEKKKKILKEKHEQESSGSKKKRPSPKKNKEKISLEEELRKSIEEEIEMKEERIKEIEIDMATEGFYKNFNSKEIIEEYTRLKRELPLLYEKWEELV
ncbi:MAG TPA: ABC-F family ATP-binding cassette domain-containing protein [Candidatus Eremiobacteraeota bacterium]|nr:ABC-F family ATP-binding cassette domain-containing protein [Candidatus Eremiobacteraeota bacterium]